MSPLFLFAALLAFSATVGSVFTYDGLGEKKGCAGEKDTEQSSQYGGPENW